MKWPTNEILELIHRRRNQLTVHSCIYYELNDSLVSDEVWQRWADELTWLQFVWGWRIGLPDDELFHDWDGTTGMHLTKSQWGMGTAIWLMKITVKELTNDNRSTTNARSKQRKR